MTPCGLNEGVNPYEALVKAIVEQAVKDYVKAANQYHKARADLRANPRNKKARIMQTRACSRMKEVALFFRSQWFRDLYELDGMVILKKLKKECRI